MIAVWIVLALGGRWQPERTSVDRAGRILEVYWIALDASCYFNLQLHLYHQEPSGTSFMTTPSSRTDQPAPLLNTAGGVRFRAGGLSLLRTFTTI